MISFAKRSLILPIAIQLLINDILAALQNASHFCDRVFDLPANEQTLAQKLAPQKPDLARAPK